MHEHEKLKEGAWLEPALAFCERKPKENWTEKHRNVAKKIFLEVGCTQKRLFDIGWSDVIVQDTRKHKKVQALPMSRMARSQAGDSGALQEVEAKGENVEERMEMAKRYSRAPSQ